MYVQDVADAFVATLDSDIQGAINIASGQPIALKTIVRKIAQILDCNHLIQLGALPTPPDEAPLIVSNPQRLQNEVQWTPKFNLDSGLRETIDYWKANR
ncbi:TPA: hypothetical protein DDW35_09300 [Candidatus Sumerlaeota bacterium]|nr:hypothetical protein [Candidatus Sumerlaeota bacterium]